MFSCIKYKAGKGKDKDDESGNPKPNKDSSKGITKQLKGLALKVAGGSSSSKQSKLKQERGRIPAAEWESEQQRETHVVPSSPAASWDNINIDMTMTGGYDENYYSPAPGAEITSSNTTYDDDLGFVAVPTTTTTRSANADADAGAAEWVAHVEEGVSIVFVSLPNGGGNDLRRIRFSRDMYDRDLAQSWWIANYERLRDLYNVQTFNGHPPNNTRRGPTISHLHRHRHQLRFEQEDDEASYEGLIGRHQYYQQQQFNYEEGGASSSAAGAAAAMGMGIGVGAPAPATLTPSNSFRIDPEASNEEVEWVEQDEPGVFITIKKYADGTRHIRRLRFSRQHFETDDAKIWWLENKERVEAQYL